MPARGATGLRVARAPSAGRLGAASVRVMAKASEPGPLVSADDLPPPNCERIEVQLRKPLGLTLEENKAGDIFVVGLVPEGNAEKSGMVDVGDQLIATSALVYTNSQTYGETKVASGEQLVRLACRGEKFKTVMTAIGTIPSQWAVTLEFQKCTPLQK
mmetsp:Transcript_32376/g.102979  ORF Transcript_32376/g.102979 Transcript_32376/m.102979 type:complete len:158 (-) Transcript_32376:1103-1576(-)